MHFTSFWFYVRSMYWLYKLKSHHWVKAVENELKEIAFIKKYSGKQN